jgi:hypothetical protein
VKIAEAEYAAGNIKRGSVEELMRDLGNLWI